MTKEQMEQLTNEIFHFLNNKGVGFVCYIWDREGELGGGVNSADADIGDALVAIGRLIEHFSIDPKRLFRALMETKKNMEKN